MNFDLCVNCVSAVAVKKVLFTLLALLIVIHVFPGSGSAQLDPTFGTDGVATTDLIGNPLESMLLPDGKILVISEDDNSQTTDPSFFRFNSDGTLDTTFGTNGTVRLVIPYLNQASGQVVKAVRQSDGKVLLAGFENNHGMISRFNENGSIDTSFANNGFYRTSIGHNGEKLENIILLPDGKILVVGTSYDVTDSPRQLVFFRFSADGVLDPTFGSGAGYLLYQDQVSPGTFGNVNALRQSDGKIVVLGSTESSSDTSTRIRRFNSDGSLDSAYPTIPLNGAYSRPALQPDDKLVVMGAIDSTDLTERKHRDISILRYTSTGSPDTSFGTNGRASFDLASHFDDIPKALRIMPDGQFLVSGLTLIPWNRSTANGYYVCLARLSADGHTVTGKFLQNYAVYNDFRTENDNLLNVQPDGKILTVYLHETGSRPYLLLARSIDVPMGTYRFTGAPFDFNYSSHPSLFNMTAVAGTAEPTVYRPDTQKWYTSNLPNAYPTFGSPGDIPVASDYIGDFASELAVFRPSTGVWYISRSLFTPATNIYIVQWGTNGDVPVPADFDGDDKSDIAVFRPSNGVWYILNSSNGSPRYMQWGMSGDKPVTGDYDGDGIYDIAVWRPSDGAWYILRSSDGQASYFTFGTSGDIPVQEDFDGDGKTDIAVWRPSNGTWYIRKSSDGGYIYNIWGLSTDIPVPADYDGDTKTDIAVWRPGSGQWYITRSSDNAYTNLWWGLSTDIPVQGRY